ncbi:MAG: glycosyltransferase family 2 protein, partial [Deltaproteobacteria bacterium]|nr:glycosyltransferase family 2 protein [Deltaproteobacteria bacterium]
MEKINHLTISVIIPTYNRRHELEKLLHSLNRQTLPSSQFEIIVVDDGSTDGTPEVLDQFGDLIRLVKFEKNQGAIAARNHGASLATGEYLVFLDGDDIFMPWTLQVYERLIETQNPKIILGQRSYFRGEVPKMGAKDTPDKIDFVNYQNWLQKDRGVAFGASGFVLNSKTFWDVGGWSPGIFHLDMPEILLKLCLSGTSIIVLSPSTVWYRIHSNNTTHSIAEMIQCGHSLLKKEKLGEYPGGRKHWFERSSLLGGPMLFWIKRGIEKGLYREAIMLAGPAGLIIFATIVRRFVAILKGRREV